VKARLRRKIEKRPYDAKGRTVFVAKVWVAGDKYIYRRQICRIDAAAFDGLWDDPIMEMSGCSGDFARDFRRQDRGEGCPACIEGMMP
jgi:hypothetical protein